MLFDTSTGKLSVKVMSASKLPSFNVILPLPPDPYATIYLGSKTGEKRSQAYITKTVCGTRSPSWNEEFEFYGVRTLGGSWLCVTVFDFATSAELGWCRIQISRPLEGKGGSSVVVKSKLFKPGKKNANENVEESGGEITLLLTASSRNNPPIRKREEEIGQIRRYPQTVSPNFSNSQENTGMSGASEEWILVDSSRTNDNVPDSNTDGTVEYNQLHSNFVPLERPTLIIDDRENEADDSNSGELFSLRGRQFVHFPDPPSPPSLLSSPMESSGLGEQQQQSNTNYLSMYNYPPLPNYGSMQTHQKDQEAKLPSSPNLSLLSPMREVREKKVIDIETFSKVLEENETLSLFVKELTPVNEKLERSCGALKRENVELKKKLQKLQQNNTKKPNGNDSSPLVHVLMQSNDIKKLDQALDLISKKMKLLESQRLLIETKKKKIYKRKDSEQSSVLICNICFERNKNTCCVPCGHMLCGMCFESIMKRNRECPFCRKRIQKGNKLFF